MEYTRLGRSGLKVSRLCLGTMNFGWDAAENDSYAIMDRALEHGINFFDTANVYGWKMGEGLTEQILAVGSVKAAVGGKRSCWRPRSSTPWANGPTARASALCISARPAKPA